VVIDDRRWLPYGLAVAVVALLLARSTRGCRTSIGPILGEIQADLGMSATVAGPR
jgi:cyanate permease